MHLTGFRQLVTTALCAFLGVFSLVACTSTPNPTDIRSYAQQISAQLMASGTYVRGGERVMITTPAWLEGDLRQADLIALQLQEGLMAELHKAHLHVVEFKLTDGVRVTAQGDFALSRDYLELRETQAVNYVLTATAVQRHDGVTVNARLIGFTDQVVAATAEVTIPQVLVDQLRSEEGVQLVAR